MRFSEEEQNFIQRWFKTGQFFLQVQANESIMNCKADCSDCMFKEDCIIGGTADWSVVILADLQDCMPEVFL